MNSEFWNIFQWKSNGFSDRIPIGIIPSPVGLLFEATRHSAGWKWSEFQAWIQPEFGVRIQMLLDIIFIYLFIYFKIKFKHIKKSYTCPISLTDERSSATEKKI